MVVFFDIDGTLVDDDTQILPESAVRAVEALRDRGHIPVINTGRPFLHIDPRVRAMAFAGWICSCGMEVRLGQKVLSRTVPTLEQCLLVRDAVRECRMRALYETDDGGLLLDEDPAGVHGDVQIRRLTDMGIYLAQIGDHPRFQKLVTFDGASGDRQTFLERVRPCFDVVDRGRGMLELMGRGCSKARGMEILLKELGADPEDTLAIGDSTNDLPMFRAAGHTVCMGGGMAQARAEAEYVTAPVLEDGIAEALAHFGLI